MTGKVAARLIRAARTGAGLTQAELARRAGMPRSAVNAYEHGARDPGAETLARLVGASGSALVLRRDPVDPVRNARILEQVLDLAEQLPSRRRGALRFPPWRTLRGPSRP